MFLFADTHTLTPNLITDIRFTYLDRLNHAVSSGLGGDPAQLLGLKGVPLARFRKSRWRV